MAATWDGPGSNQGKDEGGGGFCPALILVIVAFSPVIIPIGLMRLLVLRVGRARRLRRQVR